MKRTFFMSHSINTLIQAVQASQKRVRIICMYERLICLNAVSIYIRQ